MSQSTGITSGVPCDWSLKKLNQTLCNIGGFPSGSCQHDLAEFRRPSGTPVQPGDSGGPLWYKDSSTAGIRGVVSLRAYDLFEGWNSYATQYQTIANYYRGVAIIRGSGNYPAAAPIRDHQEVEAVRRMSV